MIQLHQELFPVSLTDWLLASRDGASGDVPGPAGRSRVCVPRRSGAPEGGVAVGDATKRVDGKRGAEDASEGGCGCERVGGGAMKQVRVALSVSLLGLTRSPVEEEEVDRGSLPGRGPARRQRVTFGSRVRLRCCPAGGLGDGVDFLGPANCERRRRQRRSRNQYDVTVVGNGPRLIVASKSSGRNLIPLSAPSQVGFDTSTTCLHLKH